MKDYIDYIPAIKKCLGKSPTGQGLLDFAEGHGISIQVNKDLWKTGAGASYYPGKYKVELGLNIHEKPMASILGHELFHAWQDHIGLLSFSKENLAAFIVHVRLFEAVAHGIQSIIARELDRNLLIAIMKPHLSDQAKSDAFRKGFNKIAGKRLEHYDKKALICTGTPIEGLNKETISQEIKDMQELIPELTDKYGKMFDGLNIFEQTGGFDKKQTETIFRPFSK